MDDYEDMYDFWRWTNGQLRTMDMFKDRDGMKIDMLSNEN